MNSNEEKVYHYLQNLVADESTSSTKDITVHSDKEKNVSSDLSMISSSVSDTDNRSPPAAQERSENYSKIPEPDFNEQSSENETQISREISLISPLVYKMSEVKSRATNVENHASVRTDYESFSNLSQNYHNDNRTQTGNSLLQDKSEKDFCPFCFEEVSHFSRHLMRKHQDEEAVKKLNDIPIKSAERRDAILSLRKKGNFILSQQKKPFKLSRVSLQSIKSVTLNDIHISKEYVPCVNCLGFYKKSYLWRHKKICKANCHNQTGSRKQHLSESQTFLASIGLLGNYLDKSRLKKDVFVIMRPDEISMIAKTDPLICLYGESHLNKHKRKQMNVHVSTKMRELARLKLALEASTTKKCLIDMLKPDFYENIIAATKIISGYNAQTRSFKASSLALHMGTNLKFCCEVARKAIITKNPLFGKVNRKEYMDDIKELKKLVTGHWCHDISSLANKVLHENKNDKPQLLPLTEDVLALNNYITKLAAESYLKLKTGESSDIGKQYKILCECTLSMVLIFNRKRVGEVQFLEIESFQKTFSTKIQEECLSALTEVEKNMSSFFKRVVVFGKGSKPVPILFTRKMQEYVEILLHIRKTTNIVPKENQYIFANPGSSDRWMSGPSIIRKLAFKCGAKNPELLTSTRFRKQVATILQLMNFESSEMEQIARFMGHTEKTHKEFYRYANLSNISLL